MASPQPLHNELPNIYINNVNIGQHTISSLVRNIDTTGSQNPQAQAVIVGTNSQNKPIMTVLLQNGKELTSISNLYVYTDPSLLGTPQGIIKKSSNFKKLFKKLLKNTTIKF